MLFKDFIDKKDFIIYVDKLYKSDDFVKDIVNQYIGNNISNSIISSIRILDDKDFEQLKIEILQYISENDVLNFSEGSTNDVYNVFRLFISMVNSFGIKFERTENIFEYNINIDDINEYKYILLNRFTSFKKILEYDVERLFLRLDSKCLTFGYNDIIMCNIKISDRLIKYILNINSKCVENVKSDIKYFNTNDIKIVKSLFEYINIYFNENSIEYTFEISDNLLFRFSSIFDINDLNKIINEHLLNFGYRTYILFRILEKDGEYVLEFSKKKTQE